MNTTVFIFYRCSAEIGQIADLGKVVHTSRDESLRQKVIDMFDRLVQQKIMVNMESRETLLETKINADIDNTNTITGKLQQLIDVIKDENNLSDADVYISLLKSDNLTGTSKYLVEKVESGEDYAKSAPLYKGILDYMSSLETLADVSVVGVERPLPYSGNAFRVASIRQHNVKLFADARECSIYGACALSNGAYLLTDERNSTVKLFSNTFKLITTCKVFKYPYNICSTGEHEAAVSLDNNKGRHEILLIRVQERKIEKVKTIKLDHRCLGLAHHAGCLYVTAWTALHVYDMAEGRDRQLYSDDAGDFTVHRCAVSPDGSRVFIINSIHHQLITLNKDGTNLSTLTHPDLHYPEAIQVTPEGHVFVCCPVLGTVVQVIETEDEQQTVNTLAGKEDGLTEPVSLCYNSKNNTLVVGQVDNNIVVLKLK